MSKKVKQTVKQIIWQRLDLNQRLEGQEGCSTQFTSRIRKEHKKRGVASS